MCCFNNRRFKSWNIKCFQDKKPRYIENLLKHAEIRNRERERLLERKVQKEREAEGDEFADKEAFVTAAYRKKMEEMQKLEELHNEQLAEQRQNLEAKLMQMFKGSAQLLNLRKQ